MTTRICLWSGPRNISTAMMYAFAQRADTRVFDEPLYAHYLHNSRAHEYHPGAAAVLATMDSDGERVVRDVMLADYDEPVLFFKHMAHHLIAIDWAFMRQTVNIILTREPAAVISSYARQIETPTIEDTGYPQQVALLQYLRQLGQQPPVLDARQVLLDPRQVLSRLCQQIGIDFDEAMLSWPAGPRPEDGVWAQYWYDAVHRSTGFKPYKAKPLNIPDSLEPLLEACTPYYELLSKQAIHAV